jgi:glutathione synthase/RimK-type ligase-like ATP-grasp enzyme
VIEVNDNPTIETGEEDSILKDELYREIMRYFLQQIELKKGGQKKK